MKTSSPSKKMIEGTLGNKVDIEPNLKGFLSKDDWDSLSSKGRVKLLALLNYIESYVLDLSTIGISLVIQEGDNRKVCKTIKHYYVDGVCAECGHKEG